MSVPDEPTVAEPTEGEPTGGEPTGGEPGPGAGEPAPLGSGTEPVSPAQFPPYGVYAPAPVETVAAGDPLRGLLAGAGVAVLGAILWAVVVYLSKYEIGLLAVVIGYGVGYTVHRVGGVATQRTAIIAAVLAGVGILLGFVLTTIAAVAQTFDLGFFEVVSRTTDNGLWGTVLSSSVSGLDWFFLAIGAFSAWRLVAQQRRPVRRG